MYRKAWEFESPLGHQKQMSLLREIARGFVVSWQQVLAVSLNLSKAIRLTEMIVYAYTLA